MAEKKFPKGSEEWEMFVDFWRIVQKYWIVEDTSEYWKALLKEIGTFSKAHKTILANKLITAYVMAQEEKIKGEQLKLNAKN